MHRAAESILAVSPCAGGARAHRASLAALLAMLGGCGGSGSPSPAPAPVPVTHTAVTLLLSSTASDALSRFTVTFATVTLTSRSGTTVTLLGTPQDAELLHLNGGGAPLITAEVPADTYIAASATLADATVSCVSLGAAGGLLASTSDQGAAAPASLVSVNLPQPITIGAAPQVLKLELQAAASATAASCDTANSAPIRPTFKLTEYAVAAQPTSSANGRLSALDGIISAVAPAAFSVTSLDGLSWTVALDRGTTFSGIDGPAGLVAGLPVSFDALLKSDGSLVATSVMVSDHSPAQLTAWRGPLTFVAANAAQVDLFMNGVRGSLFPHGDGLGAVWNLGVSGATYQVALAGKELGSLPFHAQFDALTAVPGQNVHVTTHAIAFPNSPGVVAATTLTLLPQTVQATVTGAVDAGGYVAYTLALAPFDLFNALATQPDQVTKVAQPATLVAYVGPDTSVLASGGVAAGATLRFNGLVFNDNGTLRMACVEVLDGAR
jgi:hypothetical protein